MATIWPTCLVLLLLGARETQAKQKPVNINLSAKWKSTPLVLEASEFLAKESSDSFWTYVDRVAEQDPDSISTASDDIRYRMIQKFASELLTPLQLSLLKFSLALRAYSPAVNMFQQMVAQIDIDQNCDAFIDVNGKHSCNANELTELLTTAITRSPSPLFEFDHVYPSSGQKAAVVILYAELGTEEFVRFHPVLAKLASTGEITYVLRHHVKNQAQNKLRLSGYGVELAIKSTEYKAKDDTKVEDDAGSDSDDEEADGVDTEGIVFSKLRELHPELKTELKEFRTHLFESATEITPFKVWELQDLSYQASEKILTLASTGPEEALTYLRDISQNFPTMARSLARLPVSSEFKKEVKRNKEKFAMHSIPDGESLLYLNGLAVDMEIYDVFTLLDVMTSEARLVEGLHALGMKGTKMQKILQLDLKEGDDLSYAVDIRHDAVEYLNDLATDKTYRNWPDSIQDMLRPQFPGMLRHIAKNIFHLIFVVDPVSADSKALLKMAEAFLVHKAPLRLGIVFSTKKDARVDGFVDPGVALVRAFQLIALDKNNGKALSFLTDVYEKIGSAELTSDAVIAEFSRQYPDEDKELLFGEDSDYDNIRKLGNRFVHSTGLSSLPQVLVNGVPLDTDMFGDNFEEAVVMAVMKQTETIQTAVYKGQVSDRTDILNWWMEKDNVLPRLNSKILAPPTLKVDLTGSAEKEMVRSPALAAELSVRDLTSAIADGLAYVTRKDEKAAKSVTMWVVADLETIKGRELMYTAVKHVKATQDNMRLSIIFNPSSTETDQNRINRAVFVALQTLPMGIAKSLVTKLVKEENAQGLLEGTKTLQELEVNGMDTEKFIQDLNKQKSEFLKVHQQFASRALFLEPGIRAVVTNGAALTVGVEEELTIEDIGLMERVAASRGAKKVADMVKELGVQDQGNSDLVMKVCALLTGQEKQQKRHRVDYYDDKFSVVKLPADPSLPAFTVEAILDPISSQAQKMSSMLLILQQITNVDIRIYLNPKEKLSELPLKNFYRFVLDPEITFDEQGKQAKGPSARFLDLPHKSLLTLKMDTPESWIVEAVTSPYDLDNILLSEVEKSVSADFELEHLLIEGHGSDASTQQPPRGLQFILGTDSEPAMVDTIVMANLGYFQLKANPGVWALNLREGRSKEIYTIESTENTDTPINVTETLIAINSFKSKIIKVKVAKQPGMEDKNLLADEEEEGGLWDSISSSFSGGTKEEDKDEVLNIFSVASGHLYERFLRIMMLSVLKNTQTKVKFWFLKNYLSPSFKDFIPHMAKEYGFEYELVQYKWPRWLNQQKEKQRIIWGYKILFLDVLFPLDVKKFIFVDADQIVRANLQELNDLDLGGAPYGYTPFCDSNKAMDGFRFWKSGYWRSHMAGRKYHISALYVVDLKKFRRIAAGDRLRGQYQGLSHDPNSLANLDQDLPNNMIHQVAIKSLPQEWLYCETWCDVSTKAQAKTIDLCNNPLTKEPKLTAAMRIVPEWKDYDYEVKVLWDEIYKTNTKEQIEYEPPKLVKKTGSHTEKHSEL